ncbi:hypothetical protein HZS_7070 [Henneguya salminicola]|uniref:Eukaryotic translation initiation factor 6 n=1 Tax=Henneguya salminicola TaxID=69463 RepID=A0A6G3MGK7_HENSL|nr:hypothetical protein HZS_7070 [Henneguya salminicola]
MISRASFNNVDVIGCYSLLTNSYCLVSYGESMGFYSTFEQILSDYIPVIQASIFNSILVGTLAVGNRQGLLVPLTTTDQELQHLRNSLPDTVKVQRVEERLSALGNVIACNDYVALIHPDLEKETEYIIADTLQVEVFRQSIAKQALVGTYSNFNNVAGIVHPQTSIDELDELSNLLQIPLTATTVNRGSNLIGSGVVMNDWSLFCGASTTGTEFSILSKLVSLQKEDPANKLKELKQPIIASLT